MYIILGSFCSLLNQEGAVIRAQIRPRKITDNGHYSDISHVYTLWEELFKLVNV